MVFFSRNDYIQSNGNVNKIFDTETQANIYIPPEAE